MMDMKHLNGGAFNAIKNSIGIVDERYCANTIAAFQDRRTPGQTPNMIENGAHALL